MRVVMKDIHLGCQPPV